MLFLNKFFGRISVDEAVSKVLFGPSLRTKLIVAFSAVAIVPLLFATIISTRTTEQATLKTVFEKNMNLAVGVAAEINQLIEEKTKLTKILTGRTEIKSMNVAAQKQALKSIVGQYPDLLIAFVAAPNGDLIIRSDGQKTKTNFGDRDYFRAATKSGTTAVSDVIISRMTGKPGIVIAEPIKHDDGSIRGMLCVTVDLQKVINRVGEIKVGNSGYVYVVNREGKVVMHPDKTLIDNATDLSALVPVKGALSGKKGSVEYDFQGKAQLAGYSPVSITGWGLVAHVPLEEAMAPAVGVRRANVTILFIAGLLAVIIGFVLAARFAKPIAELATAAGRMAAGDLSNTIVVKGDREIAELGNAINKMSESLKEMLRQIRGTGADLDNAMKQVGGAARRMSESARAQQEATEKAAAVVNEMTASIKSVAENADHMSQAATNASSSTTEMALSVEEVAASSRTLAASVEETASSIGEMIASIKQVSENTDAVAASADQTSSSITEMSTSVKEVEQRAVEAARLAEKVSHEASVRGMAAAAEAIKGMENIKQTVEASAAVINRLGSRSQEIGQILKVISDVTDQTELLALNAAILAAQAGDRGKGFAVVAEEIKDLAERTAASTQEIETLIDAVREETAESVRAMERGVKAVESGVSLANITSDVLRQVAESSRQSAETARAIEKTTSEQAKGVAQIMETSVNIAGQIEQVAHALQEQRVGSERIAHAAERMREITRKVKAATQEQSAGSRQIAQSVESVTLQTAQVARSMSEQSDGVQQITDSISRVQGITQVTVDVSIEIDMAVEKIKQQTTALQAELGGFKM